MVNSYYIELMLKALLFNKNQAKQSSFFNGKSLFKELNDSYFGKFIEIINKMGSNNIKIVKDLQLPKIIVIGAESAGKSSLLENITKCAIFPRNTKVCTKLPIHLKLEHTSSEEFVMPTVNYKGICNNVSKEELLFEVTKIMDSIGEDEIIDDELIITITDNTVPMFEVYDLPGVRAYPQNMAQKTISLCEKYIQQQNTIILCVVPATTPRITSYLPLALIKKYKKETDTIIALTMADRVQEENIEELIINRITNESDEFNGSVFAGIVAVVNRTHADKRSLVDNDEYEKDWFDNNILPGGHVEFVSKSIGILNLIKKMDKLYSKYIETKWKPESLTILKNKLPKIQQELDQLGSSVEDNNIKEYTKYINEKIKNKYLKKYLNSVNLDIDILIDETSQDDTEIANFLNSIKSMEFFNIDDIDWHKIFTVVQDVFSENDGKYNLSRFDILNQYIQSSLADNHTHKIIYDGLQNIRNSIYQSVIINNCSNNKTAIKATYNIRRLVNLSILFPIIDNMKNIISEDKKYYIENEITAIKRKFLLNSINEINNTIDYIENNT
jgi:GTPase SAR1 family protein